MAGSTLFTRQSSGLVREVSVWNALMFNTAAFVGSQITWAPVVFTLAFVPIGIWAGLSTLAWATIVFGVAGVVLACIFASLATVMPKTGGDYVFTSRLIPRVGPFLGWMESVLLVFAILAVVAFEVPVFLLGIKQTGLIIGFGTGASFFTGAANWFSSNGAIADLPGFLAGLVVFAIIFWIVMQPTRRFHRIVTGLATLAVISMPVTWICQLAFVRRADLQANFFRFTGSNLAAVQHAASSNGVEGGSGMPFFTSSFPVVLGVILLFFIGFQYSAYISGEIRGNLKRGLLVPVIGALGIGVLMYTVYNEVLSRSLGFVTQLGWGSMYWLGDPKLPLGQPNVLTLQEAIARPGLWPLWALLNLAATLFPLLLVPVSILLISRMTLAWSLDRRVPGWLGEVSERLRAPRNAILSALAVALLLYVFEMFPLLPGSLATGGRLNLGATLWFSIVCALPAWILPGVNAIVGPFSRPDLLRLAPWRRALPVLGAVWVVFTGIIAWFAGVKPIYEALRAAVQPGSDQSLLVYANRSGISFVVIAIVIAAAYYVFQSLRNRASGVEQAMLYQEIPPD